jgi:hypothetical protein
MKKLAIFSQNTATYCQNQFFFQAPFFHRKVSKNAEFVIITGNPSFNRFGLTSFGEFTLRAVVVLNSNVGVAKILPRLFDAQNRAALLRGRFYKSVSAVIYG